MGDGREPTRVPPPDLFGAAHAAGRARAQSTAGVDPALSSPLFAAGPAPAGLYLGTSSWSFPGWRGLVYARSHPASALARRGLTAYGQIPMLRSVGIDRTFYAPIEVPLYAEYAAQVPDDFRFLVKAPGSFMDAMLRDATGQGRALNPTFLDPRLANETFIQPCLEGLAHKAGPLVFQLPPMTPEVYGTAESFAERLGRFVADLPSGGSHRPLYAVELRNRELLTPRLVRMLAAHGVRYCLGIHARTAPASRQANALAVLDAAGPDGGWAPRGPLVVRWSLHAGLGYEAARQRYAPFDRLVEEDVETRGVLARLAATALLAGQPVWVIANNKAEGSAPWTLLKLLQAIRQRQASTPEAGPTPG